MNRAEFATIAAAMRNYDPKEMLFTTPEMIALWYEALEDLSAKSVESTLREWVKTHNWSPKIAEIRQLAAAQAELAAKQSAYEDAVEAKQTSLENAQQALAEAAAAVSCTVGANRSLRA